MIEDTLRRIEETVRGAGSAPERRAEILRLLEDLRSELRAAAAAPGDVTDRAARLTEAVHETVRASAGDPSRRDAADRVADAVREFETSHPRLAAAAQAVADALASAGL